MIFFCGFGSILPYILYLIIIWLCVLIGFRGNILRREKSAFTIEITKNQLDKIKISDECNYINFYDSVVIENSNIQKNHTLYNHTPDIITASWKIYFHPKSAPIIVSIFENSQKLRGPPHT